MSLSAEDKLGHPIPEAGEIIGISRAMTYRLVKDGELETFKVGRKHLVLRASLLDFIERKTVRAAG